MLALYVCHQLYTFCGLKVVGCSLLVIGCWLLVLGKTSYLVLCTSYLLALIDDALIFGIIEQVIEYKVIVSCF
jgi:hypothetical protein